MNTSVAHSVRPRVLVIEDDPAQRDFLKRVLDNGGYDCDCADTCAAGRDLFARDKYACTLIDLGLPDGDGKALLNHFGNEDPCIVNIVLTGDSSAETVIDTMRAGAFDYLTKPVESAVLTAALTRAVSHHAVVVERAELFRLLYEEREHLRARVDAATADIRQYAAACETSNARLRALLHLTQVSGTHYSEEELVRRVFEEIRHHLPLRVTALHDASARKFLALVEHPRQNGFAGETIFYGSGGIFDPAEYDPLLAEAEPERMLQMLVERRTGMAFSDCDTLVYPQEFWNRPACTVAFILAPGFRPDSADREFLDMCAYLLAFEWERGKLLFHVAHQASLGNIATELVRNFIQPLTAIRTAADFLNEELHLSEVAEGVSVIQENVERLRRQTQEFRKLSLLRENSVETVRLEEYVEQAIDMLSVAIRNRNVTVVRDLVEDCECVLLNGTALARTFLDLILGALRAVDVGGKVWIRLRQADDDHVMLELSHSGRQRGFFVDSEASVLASTSDSARAHLGLRLAERTVHSCGGTVSVDFDEEGRGTLRILLPRNATRVHTGSGSSS